MSKTTNQSDHNPFCISSLLIQLQLLDSSHEQEVHRVIKYLIGTKIKGLVFKPDIKHALSVMSMRILKEAGICWILITWLMYYLGQDT